MLKVWNVSPDLRHVRARAARDVPGPLGDPRVDPRLRRLDRRRRRCSALIAVVVIGSALLIVSRLDDLRSEQADRVAASRESIFLVNNLLLVGLCAVIFWGTFFPLISELFTGESPRSRPPWFDRYTTPLAILLVLFTGIGPLFAWRRVSAGALRRGVARAGRGRGRGALVVLLALHRRALAPAGAGRCSRFAAFALAALAQEFCARRRAPARAHRAGPARARSAASCARNRRRYGGYVVHAGFAVLLIAVAASSSFQTSRDLRLRPGQSATVGDYTVHYVKPTANRSTTSGLAFGAVLDVTRTASTSPRSTRRGTTTRRQDPTAGPIGRFFKGEATSEVGLKTGAGGDLWTAMQPDLSSLNPAIVRGNRQLAGLPPERPGDRDPGARQPLRAGPATGDLPGDRQPAGGLDLDRGADRCLRSGGSRLAGARVAPPDGGCLSGQARQGAGDGTAPTSMKRVLRGFALEHPRATPPSLTAPCWSSCSPSPSSCWSPGS